MMKRLVILVALCALLPSLAQAQVDKQVEVTKAFAPHVERALKLPIAPDRTDTVRMRPEIDYAVTPLALQTPLAMQPFRPATVTYWEFNRPQPFYLKAGAGYPLNSVLDFYASSQNPGTGYVIGYLNHEGRYAKIANEFDIRNRSTRMMNRIGASAGKYFGRYTLGADIAYENCLYHRYGMYADTDVPLEPALRTMPGSSVDYGDADIALRFGNDFKDLSYLNFEVLARGGLFTDHSERADNERARQTTLEASARVARAFGRHRFALALGYERLAGLDAMDDYTQQLFRAGLRYGLTGERAGMEVGVDYYHDKAQGFDAQNYVLPFAHVWLDLGSALFRPFIEVDGCVRENGFRSLSRQNPYVGVEFLPKSSVDYNLRAGVGGSLWKEKLDYRLYAAFSIRDNHVYWYTVDTRDADTQAWQTAAFAMLPAQGRQTVFSLNGEFTWRPHGNVSADFGVHLYSYNREQTETLGQMLHNGAPTFEGHGAVRYTGRKVSFGAGVWLQNTRKWSAVTPTGDVVIPTVGTDEFTYDVFEAPFAADLRVNFEWKAAARTTLFAEGRNLLNRKLYEFPWYPEYGANCTVGVKMSF